MPKKKKTTPKKTPVIPDLMGLVGQKVIAWPHNNQLKGTTGCLKMKLIHVDLNAGTVTLKSKKRLLIMGIDNVDLEIPR